MKMKTAQSWFWPTLPWVGSAVLLVVAGWHFTQLRSRPPINRYISSDPRPVRTRFVSDCDLSQISCQFEISEFGEDDEATKTLVASIELTPRPIRQMVPVTVDVKVCENTETDSQCVPVAGLQTVAIDVVGVTMDMGENYTLLERADKIETSSGKTIGDSMTRWTGKVTFGACTEEVIEWSVRLQIGHSEMVFSQPFRLITRRKL